MATANELFAANGEDYIVIDSDLRTMTFPASVNNIGVENDKDVHKLNFKMPRYFSGYDLSEFIIHINYVNANGDADMYYVLDPTINENEIIFTWLVGRHACLYRGSVTFIICLKLADGEGDVAQEFNTTLASLQVLPGLETEPTILETEHDVIEQLLLSINDTNAKIKAVLDTGLTPEQIAEFYNKSKNYDTQITALNTKTTVTNGENYTNLNDLKSTAIYSYDTTSDKVQNAPDTGTYFNGTLYVTYYNANKSAQVFIRPLGDVWTRCWWNGTWRSWTKLANQSDVDTLNSRTFWINQIDDVTILANSDTVLTLTKSTKAFMFIASANPAVCGVFICSATSINSNVAFLPVLLGSALSLSADGNQLIITNSSASVAYAYGFIVDGSGITA